MNEICNPRDLTKQCNQYCLKQVTQFLLEICGLEVPSLGWLIDNKMSPVSTQALIKNGVRFIEMFPVPVIVLNSDGVIHCVNSNFCNQIGNKEEELIGSSYLKTVLNNKKYDNNGRYSSTILLSLETEQEFYRRYTSINLGSSERTRFDISTKLIRDEQGNVNGVCAVFFDLDESTSLIKDLLKAKIQLLSEKPEVAFTLNQMTADLDSRTKQHSQNVSKLALELGELIGLNEYQLGELRTASILHNIGAVGIPKNIYFKNDYLTEEEKEIVKNHSRIAYELLEGVPQFRKVSKIILHHHENYDGNGYPDGLRGEEIPLESRIIAIAEVFDHLTTDQGYRNPMSFEQALIKIEKSSGIQFDPTLVPEFCKVVKKNYRAVNSYFKNYDQNVEPDEYRLSIYELYTLIRLLNKMFEEEVGRFAKSLDLTFPQVHLMTILYYNEGLLVSEIAKIGAWHISTVMSILYRLAQKGMTRNEAVEKGKGSYVFLTEAGKKCLEKMPIFSSDIDKEFIKMFAPETLGRNLPELYAVLEKYYGQALIDQIKEHLFCAHRTLKQNVT